MDELPGGGEVAFRRRQDARLALDRLDQEGGGVRRDRVAQSVGVVVRGVDAGEVVRVARENGLLVNSIGADVVRLAPALTLSAPEADLAVDRLSAAIAAAPALG